MNGLLTFDELKKAHEELYDEVYKNRAALLTDAKGHQSLVTSLRDRAEQLTANITKLSGQVGLMDEYNWLTAAALKWQMVYSSIFNTPMVIEIMPPSDKLRTTPPLKKYSEDDLKEWREQKAYYLGFFRVLSHVLKDSDFLKRFSSTEEELNADWRIAQIEFAADVLDGKINFIRQITAKSYWRLRDVWLREVKQLKAYYIWEGSRGQSVVWHKDTDDYFQACDQMRQMLVMRQLKKDSLSDFEEAKVYLEDNYLDRDWKLDPRKARHLFETRAHEVYESGGDPDEKSNYFVAETYLRMFYDNIVPAVVKDDSEKILMVLKAFQYSRALDSRYRLINCFEVALATYFLNPVKIEKLWAAAEAWGRRGKPYPPSWLVSSVECPQWPTHFDPPQECERRFWLEGGSIMFKGVMTRRQKKALLMRLKNRDLRDGVKELYRQSRLVPAASTL